MFQVRAELDNQILTYGSVKSKMRYRGIVKTLSVVENREKTKGCAAICLGYGFILLYYPRLAPHVFAALMASQNSLSIYSVVAHSAWRLSVAILSSVCRVLHTYHARAKLAYHMNVCFH